jgi:hypothetical protein
MFLLALIKPYLLVGMFFAMVIVTVIELVPDHPAVVDYKKLGVPLWRAFLFMMLTWPVPVGMIIWEKTKGE